MPRPKQEVQSQDVVQPLRDGGAADLRVTVQPLWVIALAPSGAVIQLLWRPDEQGYHVSRFRTSTTPAEDLGFFAEPAAAVARALEA